MLMGNLVNSEFPGLMAGKFRARCNVCNTAYGLLLLFDFLKFSSQLLLLEQKKDDGTWPCETTTYTGTNVSIIPSSLLDNFACP